MDVLEIRMQSVEMVCSLCGAITDDNCGVPIVNGDIVSNDFPDAIWSEHGGSVPACQRCHDRHSRGEIETFDRHYLWLGLGFIHGAGI